MPIEIVQLLDPEIVNPSNENVGRLEFWNRMLLWSSVQEMRLGPGALSSINALMTDPPTVEGLASHDFWTIVGKFSARGLQSSGGVRAVCDKHTRDSYSPVLGHPANKAILVEDLKSVGPKGHVALGTDASCWHRPKDEKCSACELAPTSRITSPVDLIYSRELAEAWRNAFLSDPLGGLRNLQDHSSRMFPAVEFSESAWGDLQSLSGDENSVVATIVKHLSVLNDHVATIWRKCVTTSDREAALGSHGVTASPESPQTHRNVSAMRARDFVFESRTVRCEWHTKLKPNVDRIYFAVEEGNVMVGAIIQHLPT